MSGSTFKAKINLITKCAREKVKYFPRLERNHPF